MRKYSLIFLLLHFGVPSARRISRLPGLPTHGRPICFSTTPAAIVADRLTTDRADFTYIGLNRFH